MVEIDRVLEVRDDGSAMVLQVHDELVVEAPSDEAPEIAGVVQGLMEGIVALRVPLRVDVATGAHLAETKA